MRATLAQQPVQKPVEKTSEKRPKNSPARERSEIPHKLSCSKPAIASKPRRQPQRSHARVHINSELGVRQFARLTLITTAPSKSIEIHSSASRTPSGGTADILPSATPTIPIPPSSTPLPTRTSASSQSASSASPPRRPELPCRHHVSHVTPWPPHFCSTTSFDRSGVSLKSISKSTSRPHARSSLHVRPESLTRSMNPKLPPTPAGLRLATE